MFVLFSNNQVESNREILEPKLHEYQHSPHTHSHHSPTVKPKTRCCGSVGIKNKANKSGGRNGTH